MKIPEEFKPLIKGISIGKCKQTQKRVEYAEMAHVHIQKQFLNWICFNSRKTFTKEVLIHEVAHIIRKKRTSEVIFPAHDKEWRDALVELDGSLTMDEYISYLHETEESLKEIKIIKDKGLVVRDHGDFFCPKCRCYIIQMKYALQHECYQCKTCNSELWPVPTRTSEGHKQAGCDNHKCKEFGMRVILE